MSKKQDLVHITFYYISHLIYFSRNSKQNIENNQDKHLHFISDFAMYQQSPIKRLCSKIFLIIPFLRRQDSFFWETIFQIVVIYLDKSTKIYLTIYWKSYFTLSVRVQDARKIPLWTITTYFAISISLQVSTDNFLCMWQEINLSGFGRRQSEEENYDSINTSFQTVKRTGDSGISQ